MRVFFQLSWFFKQEKRAYITGILLLLIVAFLQLIPPKIIGIIVDEIHQKSLTSVKLLQWLLILIITGLMMYIFRYFWRKMIYGSAVKLAKELRNKLYNHFTAMPQSFYQRHRVGDLMAHATNDIQAVQQTAGSGVLTLVDSLATGGMVIVAMAAAISWKLTLIALIPMPLMAMLTNWYGKLLHQRFSNAQAAFSQLNDKVQESVTGIKVIKSFGQEKENTGDFESQSANVVSRNIAVAKVDSLYDPTISVIVAVCFLLSIGFGAKFVIQGELSLGELISFTTYLGLLVWPMLAFGWLFNILERGRASYERILSLLAEKSDLYEKPDALDIVPSGNIEFRLNSFTYPGEDSPVLKDIYFRVKRGETVGIVGRTGSGKTTLLKLLLREFDAEDGEILFGGRSIKDYKLGKLREAFGYVPQDHFLFSATIRENITFSSPGIEHEKAYEAAKAANIHDDIMQFPDKYETMTGERGVSLSGGQKQRVSIARALLLDPEVLVLDDALSAVDAKTEEGILRVLREKRQNKTTIITSHRLSSIAHANLILVLAGGTIAERGTHDELIELGGLYKDMFERQQLEAQVEQGG